MSKYDVTVYYTYCKTFKGIEADSFEDAADKACIMGQKLHKDELDFVDYQNCEVARLDKNGIPVEYETID